METNFDPLKDIPWMKDGSPVPSVHPADLKRVWEIREKLKKELEKHTPNRDPNQGFGIAIDHYPGADAMTVWYRLMMFETVQRISKETGGPILPTMPSDAVFKALGVVPITNGGHEGIRIDAKELIRLIQKESEA